MDGKYVVTGIRDPDRNVLYRLLAYRQLTKAEAQNVVRHLLATGGGKRRCQRESTMTDTLEADLPALLK